MRRSSPEEQAAWRHECQQYDERTNEEIDEENDRVEELLAGAALEEMNDHPPEADRPATAAEIRHYPSYDSVYDLPF